MYLCEYKKLDDTVAGLPYFIEEVYNQKRFHSALGYLTPNDFEKQMIIQKDTELPCQTILTLLSSNRSAVHA